MLAFSQPLYVKISQTVSNMAVVTVSHQ